MFTLNTHEGNDEMKIKQISQGRSSKIWNIAFYITLYSKTEGTKGSNLLLLLPNYPNLHIVGERP